MCVCARMHVRKWWGCMRGSVCVRAAFVKQPVSSGEEGCAGAHGRGSWVWEGEPVRYPCAQGSV